MLSRACLATVAAFGIACGGSPTPPSAPQGGIPPANESLSGLVVSNQGAAPIAGASVDLRWTYASSSGSRSAVTDGAGRFSLDGLPRLTLSLTLSAPGYLEHDSLLNLTGTRTGAALDMIQNAPPFSLDFYRQFARNGFESSQLSSTRPWTVAPSFYLRTVTDDTGDPVADSVIAGITRVVVNSVPGLSGGHFTVAAFETGADARPLREGWVNILLRRNHSLGSGIAGNSTVGGNSGVIRIVYDPAEDALGLHNVLQCEAAAVSTADHEIVHTMGFFHTAMMFSDFHSGPGCPGQGRPENVQFHAAVMYSRPPGNVDPDTDTSVLYSFSGRRPGPTVISCPVADVR